MKYLSVLVMISIMVMGCGEESPETVLDTEVLGDLKYTGEDAVPMAPAMAGVPYIKEIGYYRDWRHTKPVEGSVPVGKTIYVKVVFSEEMELVVSDGKDARPVVFYRVGKTLTRFRIKGFKVKGGMTSGDLKPKGNTSVYVGKYTVADDGLFTIAVGKLSADTQGTPMSAFYTHKAKVVMGDGEGAAAAQEMSGTSTVTKPAGDTDAPRVTGVTWYRDRQLTEEVETPEAGNPLYGNRTYYIKVVFSEPMQYIPASDETARPSLYIDSKRVRILPRGASGDEFTQRSCKPLGGGTDDFVCKYTIPERFEGPLAFRVGAKSSDVTGVRVAEASEYTVEVINYNAMIYRAQRKETLERLSLPEMSDLDGRGLVAQWRFSDFHY